MAYAGVQRYADRATFEKYDMRVLEDAWSSDPRFIRCPNSACSPGGQIHEDDDDGRYPIVTCVTCHQKFCFRHKVAWHGTMTCGEYDAFLRDPVNFRSRFDVENERVERERMAEKRRLRALEDADRMFAQSLIEEEQVRAEAEAQAARERQMREAAERKEREKKEKEEAGRARKAAAVQKRREEEAASLQTVSKTTKKCPGCAWPIEKRSGWYQVSPRVLLELFGHVGHQALSMRINRYGGIRCKHEFCWDCLADYRHIVKKDNSFHKRSCPHHSKNVKG
ncbi:IBR domain-containing protein [Apodospora peruviana]|uniref:IBR domain-containing protein n=1 Tax=Apodospora peruviana TaxID=516989 RepID=A0AAE0MGD7_9PEZI|nr:IBR domain-containing protein [Apodospora peruviana]